MNKKTITLLLLASITLLSVAGVKVSKLTRTASFGSNDLFIVVTGSTAKVTRHIRASDLAVGLGPWITNSGGGASSVTNAISVVRSNGAAISAAATSLDFIEGTNVTIRATNAAGVVTVQINASGGAGEVTTVQLLASSNAVWAAQASKAPTNNALIGPVNSSGVALTLAALAGQDGNLLNVKDSSGSVIFAIAYDGQLAGVGANSARLASTSAAGNVWTASDTTGIGAFTAPAQQTNSSVVRQTQVTSMSNTLVTATAGKQAGSFILTNFIAMGITNIVSANANTVVTTNSGVLTLTTSGGSASTNFITTAHGSAYVTNSVTAGSFIGAGTGTPYFLLSSPNGAAFGITVDTNRTVQTSNTFNFTSVAVGDDVRAHTSSAGQIVWTNASSKILTNLVGMSFDYGLLYAATNTVAGTNIAINFSPNNTNHLDIYTTNWWAQWTNISGLAQGSLANKTIRITPSAPGQNLTNVWPVGKQHGIYQWNTNANSPIWTVLTNAKTYVLSLTAYGTNIHASMSLWEP